MYSSYSSKWQVLKSLKVWAGSIWRLIIWDLLIFFMCRTTMAIIYRFFIVYNERIRASFELFLEYNYRIDAASPLSFLIAFFVSTVLIRFITMTTYIPWLTPFAHYLEMVFQTNDEDKRILYHEIKRTYLRYLALSSVLFFRNISYSVKQRFRVNHRNISKRDLIKRTFKIINMDPVIRRTYGLLITQEEIEIYTDITLQQDGINQETEIESWVPLKWCSDLLAKLVSEKIINDMDTEISLLRFIKNYQDSRVRLQRWIEYNIPLPYLQAIIFVVYAFSINMVFSIQVNPTPTADLVNDLSVNEAFNLLLPLVIYFKFFMYIAWFKIGISMANPFYEYLSKFPTNYILNNSITASAEMALVNESVLPVYPVNHIIDTRNIKFQRHGYMQHFGQNVKSISCDVRKDAKFFYDKQTPDVFIFRKFI